MTPTHRSRPVVAALTIFSVIANPCLPVVVAGSQAAQKPAAQPTAQPAAKAGTNPIAAAAPNAPKPPDGGWPRFYGLASGASILLYQPQIASWDQQKHIVAFSAVSYRDAKTGDKPALGTIKVEADTRVSVADRLVNFSPLKITEANFSTLQKPAVQEITAQIDKAIPEDRKSVV